MSFLFEGWLQTFYVFPLRRLANNWFTNGCGDNTTIHPLLRCVGTLESITSFCIAASITNSGTYSLPQIHLFHFPLSSNGTVFPGNLLDLQPVTLLIYIIVVVLCVVCPLLLV
jgi:hypothetical protein